MKLPFALRGLIVLGSDFIFLWLLLDNKVDFLVKSFVIYLPAVALAWFTHGMLYGVFAGKKALEATKEHLQYNTPNQPNASTPASRAKGYWIMQGIILVAFLAVTIIKHIEISGMR